MLRNMRSEGEREGEREGEYRQGFDVIYVEG